MEYTTQKPLLLTCEIKDAMKSIRANISAIHKATTWTCNVEANKVFARMCADEILTQALELHNAFRHAGIGYRDGVPLTLSLPTPLKGNNDYVCS